MVESLFATRGKGKRYYLSTGHQHRLSVESNIDMFRIGRDVNESLALLACKGKGIGDAVRLVDDLAALTG